MFSHRIVKSLTSEYNGDDDNDLIDLLQNLELNNLKDDYYRECRKIYAENNYDHAAKFTSLFRDKYVCTNITSMNVYVFYNHHWFIDHGLKYLINDIIHYRIKLANKYVERQHFIKDVCLHLYLNRFHDKLDDYKGILLNKIVFDTNKGILRNGYPSDYISLNTLVSPSSKYIDEVNEIIRDIFPNPDVYKYVLRFLGSLLIPRNRDKIFMVWSGDGDNGKSILMRLVELALGEYSVKLPTSTITGKRTGSSNATPDMALIERKLVAFLQEPSNTERINIGIVKELTGNDTIYVRGLYEKGRNMSVLSKIIYVVNSTDHLATIEQATWNRIVVVPFSTTFVDNPNYPNEKKKNKLLLDKLRMYAPSLLQIMVDEAKEYLKYGLFKSIIVESNTNKIKGENNHVTNYLNMSDVSTNYPDFVQYMRSFMPKEPIPSLKAFQKELVNKHK
jgi:hypothetical protein